MIVLKNATLKVIEIEPMAEHPYELDLVQASAIYTPTKNSWTHPGAQQYAKLRQSRLGTLGSGNREQSTAFATKELI
jgi:hypothetical protein